jgi:HK97 family phage major capsid protein
MTIRDLLAALDAKKTEIRAMRAPSEQTPEEAAQFDALIAEKEKLEGSIRRQAALDDLDRNAGGLPIGNGGIERRMSVFSPASTIRPKQFDGEIVRTQAGEIIPVLEHRHKVADFIETRDDPAAELGLGGFLRALYKGPSNELERRVLGGASIGAGGATVPTPIAAEVIDVARNASVALRAGVRTMPMTAATLKFARVTADPTGGWRAENATITESDPTFDQVTLSAKSWALLTRISRELLEDGANVDALLRQVFASAAGVALDQAILVGSGASNQPLGIRGMAGIQNVSMGTNGGTFSSWSKALDAVQALETANYPNISAMIMSPRTARTTYGLADSTGQPLTIVPRLASIPNLTTPAMPINETQGTATNASSILMGDFSNVFLGLRTDITISVLNERYADSGQVGFVVWMRADVVAARPAAIARIAGIIP